MDSVCSTRAEHALLRLRCCFVNRKDLDGALFLHFALAGPNVDDLQLLWAIIHIPDVSDGCERNAVKEGRSKEVHLLAILDVTNTVDHNIGVLMRMAENVNFAPQLSDLVLHRLAA